MHTYRCWWGFSWGRSIEGFSFSNCGGWISGSSSFIMFLLGGWVEIYSV
jgi:hypothetical protein